MLLTIASGVIVPAWMWPITLASPNNAIGVVPLIIAFTAPPPPRNGTRTQSAPRSFFIVSM